MRQKIQNIVLNQRVRDKAKIILLFFWMLAIFVFSALPGQGTPADLLTGVTRKLAHFVEFGILMFLMFKALRLVFHETFYQALWTAMGASIGYAIIDEIHQRFVSGRFGTVRDVVIDTSGVLIVSLLIYLEHERQLKVPHKRYVVKM